MKCTSQRSDDMFRDFVIFTESLSFSAENTDCILENLIRIKETVSEEEAYSEKADYKTNPFLYSFFFLPNL